MRTQDFDFYLPSELIAQHPTEKRRGSRLLHLDGNTGHITDSTFATLTQWLSPKDLIIFNDTRVIKARLFGVKSTGGNVEVMIERVINDHEALAHVRASRAPKAGATLLLEGAIEMIVTGRENDLFQLRCLHHHSLYDLLEQYGHLPLPPYITHAAAVEDESRYQTVYAKHAGAVAAPTAGLHFDELMLADIQSMGVNIGYVTLHVGAGTFQPVKVDDISAHKMHSERYQIPAETVELIEQTKRKGGRVIAVGTTALRALESAAQHDPISSTSGETNIFITPGYQFKVVDRLLTNFHLPKSTLMMLVSAFAQHTHVMAAYQHAVHHQYRFFSYGDAMLIERANLSD
ncbi:MAG: tRNA preQ1(34) S-adenosylmethionine ribosyltransferase-isomerase QueA [Methylophilaceae bacterium 17-44-8]|nr:MAG: tRNA preQ1(34) S-adenosylmethionine ribosyltransferase-isomerase QueA [Methylophilales bacterium 28-44-11]OZA06538.1 MAG: tRNA preQ1(34) S-adenosylmethionine ribosyltransferase-isomerase QueA [Methylophilaceae bacterium 17-44-8]